MFKKYDKNRNKKGFTLVELAIVIAVIAALAVGLLFSDSVIQSARVASYARKLNRIESAIQEFQATHGNPGYMTFEECVANPVFQNSSRKFCRAMYCTNESGAGNRSRTDEPCVSNVTFAPSTPAPYIATKMLSMAGYIDPMPDVVQSDGTTFTTDKHAIAAPSEYVGINIPIASNIIPNMTMANSVIQTILPEFASGLVYHVEGGRPDEGVHNYFSTSFPYSIIATYGNYSTSELAKRYNIKVTSREPKDGAGMTSELAYRLDVKLDDGNPAGGLIIAARPILKAFCFNTKDNSTDDNPTKACAGNMWSPFDDADSLTSSPDYSCFNIQTSNGLSARGNGMTGFFTYNNTTAKYTASVSKGSELLSKQGTAATGATDSTAKSVARRAKSDKTMGCNIMYITNAKWRD